MDGLDIAYCGFQQTNTSWSHSVHATAGYPYSEELLGLLNRATKLSAIELVFLDKKLGKYFAECVNDFISKNALDKKQIDAIASHGHTIFHQPDRGITHQIGCGQTLAFHTGIKVINDFRQKDVISGGQGAPLVPIGDALLFNEQSDTFLNIGGFSNVCFLSNPIVAFDVCPGNLPLNSVAQQLGIPYDSEGMIAATGTIDHDALNKLNQLSYYSQKPPKSLGTEWLNAVFNPVFQNIPNHKDQLSTLVEHIAFQIGKTLNERNATAVFITGGGAKNTYLIERIRFYFSGELIVPRKEIIDYKEAIIFAFLGALYLSGVPNCLSAVTGASKDEIGGVLHIP